MADAGSSSTTKTRGTPLATYLRQRRHRRLLAWGAGLVLFGAAVAADHAGLIHYDGGDWRQYHGKTFRVERIIDGDTIVIKADDDGDPVTRVRLWGMDTPELARPDLDTPAEPFAARAAARARDLARGKTVTLRLQAHRLRDRYDRLLAYVDLPNGSTLNRVLIDEGLAVADAHWPHDARQEYELAEDEAKLRRRGMWER